MQGFKLTNKTVIVAIVILLLVGALILLTRMGEENVETPAERKTQEVIQEKTVTVSSSGFNPQTLTVKKNTRVVWVNESGEDVSLNSDDHPLHQKFRFLNLGAFSQNSAVEYLFKEPGTFTYHNHIIPEQKGSVIVEE